jgi:hypothetical protein
VDGTCVVINTQGDPSRAPCDRHPTQIMEQGQLSGIQVGEDLWLARHLEEVAVSRPNSEVKTSASASEAGSGAFTTSRSLYLGHAAHTGSISDLVTWSATLGEPVRGVVVSNALSPELGTTFVRVTTDDRRGLLVALTEHLKAQQVCGTLRVRKKRDT